MIRINDDSPLNSISQDQFRRGALVDLIVDSINDLTSSDHHCVVYGIYGKWGEGKTSLMNFIKERLLAQEEDDGINLVQFNPWLVESNTALLQEFFKTIATDSNEQLKAALNKYGSLAIRASKTIINAILPGIGSALAEGINFAKEYLNEGETTLEDSKAKVSDALKKSGRHLVVMIDDVDRLDKEEMHTLLRLVRQVADFENCIYLLAMDVEMVAKSIREYYGEGHHYDGRKFLDKIVQVPIILPQIPKNELSVLLYNELCTCLKGYASLDYTRYITQRVGPLFETRREIIRYINQLRFVLPNLKDEVNISDLCSLEAIKSINSEAYLGIYRNFSALSRVLDSPRLHYSPDEERERVNKRYAEALELITNHVEPSRRNSVETIIDELFTKRSKFIQTDIENKRLCTSVYYEKYFLQLVPTRLIPDSELDAFGISIVEKSNDDLINWINQKGENYQPSEIQRACLYLLNSCREPSSQLILATNLTYALSLSNLAKDYPNHLVDSDPEDLDIATFVVSQIIKKYLFEPAPDHSGLRIINKNLLNETLRSIFAEADINYCLNVLVNYREVIGFDLYDGKDPILTLAERFQEESYKEQYSKSPFLLYSFLIQWKTVDATSFDTYASKLISSDDSSYLLMMDSLIGDRASNDFINNFAYLFESTIQTLSDRIKDEPPEIKEKNSVKIYGSNIRTSLLILETRRKNTNN